jgi:hypothetical protein
MPKRLDPSEKKFSVAKPLEKEAMVRYSVDRLTSGLKVKDVVAEIMDKFKTSETNALQVVNDSKEAIKNQMQIKVPFILSVHMDRYEYLFSRFYTIGRTDLINRCLSQKEELLNLKNALTERLSEDLSGHEIENKFTFSRLSKEKQKRVRQLLEKGVVYEQPTKD